MNANQLTKIPVEKLSDTLQFLIAENEIPLSDALKQVIDDVDAVCKKLLRDESAPAQPAMPEQQQPIAYIFKHPAGRLFWSLTDESNKWQADVIPVYAEPHELKIPPAIEPDYEVIKGILPTANPDEYACCVAADMWNACRAEMLKAQPVSEPYKLPEGWVMVPQQIFLDASDIESICSQCGDGHKSGYGDFTDGLLWVGDIQCDNGTIMHGLHISSYDYQEEGGLTLAEFKAPAKESE